MNYNAMKVSPMNKKQTRPRTWRVFTILALFLTSWAGAATFPGINWQTRTPAEAGLDVAKLQAIQSYLGGRGCVIRDGYLVYNWGDVTTRGDVASAAKPWYSTFLFKAVEEGLLAGLDTAAVQYEPQLSTLNA